MHGIGRAFEERKRTRHMWTVSTRAIVAATVDGSSPSANSFCKDGRKISVGDCALFKPPQDSPPFIGIIRWLAVSKEDKLKLGVNWLYRPGEVKLGKGILLEAAPNEIFYSFHKDEIPAASLLHPCKVAFLPKGVELPSGISSFVCRQVYDVTNKCLWWLTDQDYINEHQEEVDQLLRKTRSEMHATLQSGGRSPKPMSGPTSTSQLKGASDSVQNSASSVPSLVKGKKRERGDQASEPVKRERTTKTDDGDSCHSRTESSLKSETAKITEKGGLIDSQGVERLVQLMQSDRTEKKIDLTGRSMLVGVIAVTDKFDCLSRFVQLKGLPVLDEWLQEIHKGKIGDSSGSKDGDKSVEEFLLVLLRALDKLPINLQALQMCNIGKSVNHLRTQKNLEIQKKARGLVDTWKKRVEAEMNINDARSGSNQPVPWPRTRLHEVSQGGNRHSGASTDVAIKSSVPQLSASKTASVKVVQGESTSRTVSASPGSMKPVPLHAHSITNLKDGQPRHAAGVASDFPLSTVRDEKSSSSSQSHNSQSCSSDHTKTGGLSGKEDTRSPTAGSVSGNRKSGGSSRHRKPINGHPGSTHSGAQKESDSSRSSLHKNPASEKQSQSGLSCEKALDGPGIEGNSHKLIVKIPNRVRSPAQSVSGASFEDPSIVNSRASSPVVSEKHDQYDRSLKDKSDGYRANNTSDVNTESWQSNDFKDVLTGSDEGDGSPAAVTDEERPRTGDEGKKLAKAKAASSSSGNKFKPWNSHEASLRSINALIESCVKYSESNISMSIGDDVGMNLLASVAAGEMSKSDLLPPTDSLLRDAPAVEPSCTSSDLKVKSSPIDDLVPNNSQSNDGAHVEDEKQVIIFSNVGPKNGESDPASLSVERAVGGDGGQFNSSSMDLQSTAYPCKESRGKSNEITVAAAVASSPASTMEETMDIEGGKPLHNEKVVDGVTVNAILDAKEIAGGSMLEKEKFSGMVSSLKVQMEAIEGSSSYPCLEIDGTNKKARNEGLNGGVKTEEKPPALIIHSEVVKGNDEEVLRPSGGEKGLVPENVIEMKVEKYEERVARSHFKHTEIENNESEGNAPASPKNRILVGLDSVHPNHDEECLEEKLESKGVNEQNGRPASDKVSLAFPVQETEQRERSRGSKLTGTEAGDAEECTSTTADASCISAAGVSAMDAKVEFDLNEGFAVDDGKLGERNNLTAAGCLAATHRVNPLPFPVSSVSGGLPGSITVTAAAKGPFVPPDDLLKSKGELGWKGSAATSAFRPAEPRKAPEMPQGTTSIPLPDATAGKCGRLLLDIDLNVPDERMLEDLASRDSAQELGNLPGLTNNRGMAREELMGSAPVRFSGGLDLDLNRVVDTTDMGYHSTSSGRKMDVPLVPVKSPSGSPLNDAASACRDFDLNNGPIVDEGSTETSPFVHLPGSSLAVQSPVSSLRMSNAELGNFSPWFPSGGTYSAVSIMPDRGENHFPIVATGGAQRLLGPTAGSNPFSPDVYRGPVLSSAPAVAPFPSSPFQYPPVFPFGTSFLLPSASFSGGSTAYVDSSSVGKVCYPAVHTQFLGPAGAVSSHFPRPYVVSYPDSSNNSSGESSRKWGRHALDLNAGPGGQDIEGREETSLPPRQLSVASSQFIANEQARMYQVAGGVLKRKEPEGGWDGYKQSPWQ
ncbi:hypothetical protein F2P56_003545 [Juglans regia]|uniref:Uncharacterized protein LOC108999146 isoform X1 n=2 Tax=Juglans regia TaxID=51240 RepID=A0A2I4FIL4_JUGRE|nr:uncharacterized protein LOC108999146 isoform X1 [Juglans regia]KAF5476853.1 hypothetical protein F2P56_003545 [Juglans regia]